MVAADRHDLDPLPGQPAQLRFQELAGVPIPLRPVIEIAGEQHEPHPPLQRRIHHTGQCPARGPADPVGRRLRIEAAERAVQVDVGGVQEGEIGHPPS